MIRAVVQNGSLLPLDPIPVEWADGRELDVEVKSDPTVEDWNEWNRELNELVAQIDPSDFAIVQAELVENDRLEKERMHQEMERLP